MFLCKSNAFILFLIRYEGVNFQINHKKRIYVNETTIFSLNLHPNQETYAPTGCKSVTIYISAKHVRTCFYFYG